MRKPYSVAGGRQTREGLLFARTPGKPPFGPRYELARLCRQAGMTYKQIGERLGVSAGRAHQMIRVTEGRLRRLGATFDATRLL